MTNPNPTVAGRTAGCNPPRSCMLLPGSRRRRAVPFAFILATSALAQTTSHPAALESWRTAFTDNAKLPPVFAEASAQRADGSTLTFFLGNFDNSLAARKPLLIYLDGSGAQSLFTLRGDKVAYGMFGLIAKQAGGKYHVAAIEKRGVEFGSGDHPGSADGASPEYQRHATLQDRVADTRLLLDVLLAEPRIDTQRVILMGHSEGANVAAATAGEDPRVTHVAFLSCGGAPQFYDFFLTRRQELARSGASPEEAEQAITALEGEIAAIMAQPEDGTKFWLGHAYPRWATFATQAPAEALLRTNAKLFLACGTADQSVPIESFDYLVCEILIHGRRDVTVRRYLGRDHSLMKPTPKPAGPPVLDFLEDVLKWADETR